MQEINSSNNYKWTLIKLTLIFVVALAILFLWQGGPVWIYALLFCFFEVGFLSKKYTTSIYFDSNIVIIKYMQWTRQLTMQLEKTDLKANIKTRVIAKSASKYKILELTNNKRVQYTINSQDGFTDEDLKALAEQINLKQD